MSQIGAALALAWMAAGCTYDDCAVPPLPFPPPQPLVRVQTLPAVPEPPVALVRAFDQATAKSASVAQHADRAPALAQLRSLTRTAEGAMWTLQHTPRGPGYPRALAYARASVSALSAFLAEDEAAGP